ncbi:MAG: 4Fe-4S dicluster domain-containing protein [Desulfobacterales bacterium]|nr:4Fe-4S dicluster domain-containing protein [Desulfobacterales bacterium]
MDKVLQIDYQKCTGCRLCELVCTVSHDGVSNPSRSRIKVVKWEAEGLYVPVTCQQCEDAPCVSVCPVKATSQKANEGVVINYDLCIGCRACITVCPFGARNFNPIEKKVIKCDLCGGDPQCARFCDVKAVDFIDTDRISTARKREAARRLSAAQKDSLAI